MQWLFTQKNLFIIRHFSLFFTKENDILCIGDYTMTENDLLLKNISEIGRLLLKHGAEIYRVEESLERMCESYHFEDIGVFALPSYFTLSVTFQDGTTSSITKRTTQNRNNLDAIYELNNLVRYICFEKPDHTYIEKEIQKVKQMLADYLRLKDLLKPSEKEFERQIDILLERLSKLLQQRK